MSPSAEPTSGRAEATAYLVPADLLGEGEIIVLALKPSGWFVLLVSLPVLASSAAVGALAYVVDFFHARTPAGTLLTLCAAVALARVFFACWQWLARTYVLTNRRIVTIRGLVSVQVRAVGLTDLNRAELIASVPERVLGVGSIFCLAGAGPAAVDQPAAPERDPLAWNAVARPQEILEIIDDAIDRAHRAGRNHSRRVAAGAP